MPTKKELLEKARKFVLLERDRQLGQPQIAIEWRDIGRWAITVDGFPEVVDRDLNTVWEPSPSNRDDDFLDRTRFPFDEAWEIAEQFIQKHNLRK